MDKLKPVLAQKFWILCALALVLPPSGWFLGARQLVNESIARKKSLDDTFGNAKLTGAIKNKSWADAVKKRTAVQDAYFRAAAAKLWNTQRRLMIWPPTVASLMSKADYRKPPENENDRLTAANNFRSAYYVYLKNIWKVVDPVNYPSPAGRTPSKVRIGKIMLEWEKIPKISEGTWQQLPPTADEMWDAQEDVWLVTAILRSIASVNKDATNIADASIRQIDELRLMGGNRNEGTSDAAGGAMAAGGPMARGETAVDVGGGVGGRGFGQLGSQFVGGGATAAGQGSRRAGSSVRVGFSPAEVFGSAAGVRSAGSGAPDAETDADAAGAAAPAMLAMGMGLTSVKARRYIDDDPGLPFRTRGFYLKVLIDHRRLPELVAALTNSPFPIEIVRIHQQDSESDMTIRAKPTRTARRRGGAVAEDAANPRFGGLGGQRPGFNNRTGASGLDTETRQTIDKALGNPELSWVVLQGLMTLYLPPKFEQKTAGGEDSPTTETPSPTGTPPAKTPSKPKAGTPPDRPPLPAATGSTTGAKSDRKNPTSSPPVPDRPPIPGGNIDPGKKKKPTAGPPPKPGGSTLPGKTKSNQPK